MAPGSVHYEDERCEIHRLVVGPLDNNVYVLRCKQTGGAILLDAANEHEKLLDLCQRLNVDKVLETHGHWDHIQAVPAVRDAGIEVGVTAADAAMLPSYDFVLEDDTVVEVGRLRLRTILTPGHTPGSMCFLLEGSPVLFSGDTLFPGGPGNTRTPATATTPPSAPSNRISRSGSTAAGRPMQSRMSIFPLPLRSSACFYYGRSANRLGA